MSILQLWPIGQLMTWIVALGSNIGDTRANMAQALTLLCADGVVGIVNAIARFQDTAMGHHRPALVRQCVRVGADGVRRTCAAGAVS